MNKLEIKVRFWRRKFLFLLENWKIGFHLVFRTKRFGVNNEWWSSFDSVIFGWPWYKILWGITMIYPFVRNYRSMKARATGKYWMTDEQLEIMGWKR